MHISGRKTLLAVGEPLFRCVPPPRLRTPPTLERRFLYNFMFPHSIFPAHKRSTQLCSGSSGTVGAVFLCFLVSGSEQRCAPSPTGSVYHLLCFSPYGLLLSVLALHFGCGYFSSTPVLFARRRVRPPRCGGGGAGCRPRCSRATPAAGGPHTRACVPGSNSCQNKGLQLTAAYRAPY